MTVPGSITGWSLTCNHPRCVARLDAKTSPELGKLARESGWLLLQWGHFCAEHRVLFEEVHSEQRQLALHKLDVMRSWVLGLQTRLAAGETLTAQESETLECMCKAIASTPLVAAFLPQG